ncbi:hypothetical protein NON08_14630, partial [Cetobacterium somerae]|uniref:hypothetical protein n=1 Tax=Cetobacterium sp. NK01 TaxID=2993530 RepID=UPI0021165A8E
MSKKRIKIMVSKLILDILDRDAKHFKITREKLCNTILITFSIRKTHEIIREEFDEKTYLQFTLSQSTAEYYNFITNGISDEPNFIRSIFTTYCHLNPFYREIILFRDKLIVLKDYCSKKEKIHISIENKLEKVTIEEIRRCQITDYVKLITTKGEFYMNELRIIF